MNLIVNVFLKTRKAGPDGSVDSSQVSGIMKSIGQNPSDAEIQVQHMASKINPFSFDIGN